MKHLIAMMGVLLLGGSVYATDFSLFPEGGRTPLQKCIRRCEKLYPPKPTPAPTVVPPTHTFGKTCDYELRTSRTIVFDAGATEPTLICHTPDPSAQNPPPFLELQSQNHGNASCADYWLQMYSPTGAISEPSRGAQPGAVMQRTTGRYVIAVELRQASNQACSTLTFTVR
jgi:hypothetical protein